MHLEVPTLVLTLLGQVELLELGSFLVEFSLQLLFETNEFGPLLLQSSKTLLQSLWKTAKHGWINANGSRPVQCHYFGFSDI